MFITFTFAPLGLKSHWQRNNTVTLYLRDVWSRDWCRFQTYTECFKKKSPHVKYNFF